MRNFLPFARRQRVSIDFAVAGKPGRGFTRFLDLATGSALKAHIDDVTVYPAEDAGFDVSPNGPMIKMRMGKDGHTYLTEELYDYRCYADGNVPLRSVWDWSGLKRTRPYRLQPGQKMYVMFSFDAAFGRQFAPYENLGAVFFGRKVTTGEPCYLYDKILVGNDSTETVGMLPVMLGDCVMDCPNDSAVDIYGFSASIWRRLYSPNIYIIDGNERPFWMDKRWYGIVDPQTTPILLGNARGTDEWALDPNETITFDFETPEETYGDKTTLDVDVTIRGTLEVEDGR